MAKEYLYKRIEQKLIQRITSGFYQAGDLIPGTKELSVEFETSGVTIDRALSSLVERGFVTRTARKGTHVLPSESWDITISRSGNIAVIMNSSCSPSFWTDTIRGIITSVQQRNKHVIIGNYNGNADKTKEFILSLVKEQVNGLIYIPHTASSEREYISENTAIIQAAVKAQIAYILLDRHIRNVYCNYLISNDFETSSRLTDELIAAGCTSPICLSAQFSSCYTERELGFIETIKRNGIPTAEGRIYRTDGRSYMLDTEQKKAVDLFINKQNADGILALNSELLSVATDFSLHRQQQSLRIAFFNDNNSPHGAHVIASASQDRFEYGKLAAELLMNLAEKWNSAMFQAVQPYTFNSSNIAE